MRLLLIGCEVLVRELCDAVTCSPHTVDVKFLTKGLHDQGAKAMYTGIQEAIDEAKPGTYDAIALGYGLCGNGLVGIEARSTTLVVPRVHDCIALLMGSRQNFDEYFRENTGVYFRSAGWVERGADLEPLAREQTGMGYTLDALIERYGEDNGQFLYEQFTQYQRNYQQLTFIETGIEPTDQFVLEARSEAQDKGWKFEKYKGNLGLFHRLLSGNWDEDFLIVRPGYRIVATYNDHIISAEKAQR